MKNDYVQASLRHSRFLFVYSAKHATELERMRKRGCALLESGVSQCEARDRAGANAKARLCIAEWCDSCEARDRSFLPLTPCV